MNRKFVSTLNDIDWELLSNLNNENNNQEEGLRISAILMSHEGFTIKEISIKLGVTRDSVSSWIDAWNERGVSGLRSRKRSGRPPLLNEVEEKLLEKLILASPAKVIEVKFDFEFMTGKKISISTVKRFKAALKSHITANHE